MAREHDGARGDGRPRLVVGVGAADGGLEALQAFLAGLPRDSGIAVVVALPVERARWNLLAGAAGAPLRVAEASDGVPLAADHVYVIAPGTVVEVRGGALAVTATGAATPGAADALFRSLAADQGERAVGVVLSGSGLDGTAGLRAIRERGGLAIAQAPATARHDGMPRSAIDAGLADHVLAPADVAAALLRHAGLVDRDPPADGVETPLRERLPQVCAAVRRHTGHDFAEYKDGTLLRRLARRIRVQHPGGVDAYLARLEVDPGEAAALVKDLLVSVTRFFRDPEAFRAIAEAVVPRLFQGKPVEAPIRIWVPGCATGEEAYSLAILVREHLERIGARRLVQVFATDLDAEALAAARQARYPAEIAEHVGPERLARFFVPQGQGYQARKELREMCLFSQHSLIRDPPFSQLDLISCRNVLIYLGAELQKRLGPLLHYALRPGGFLFLGPSEGIAGGPELFEVVDKKHRILRRKETVTRPAIDFPVSTRAAYQATPNARADGPGAAPLPDAQATLAATFERMVLAEWSWPALVLDERGEIALQSGPIARYVHLPPGAPTTNVFEMLRGTVRVELRAALHAAAQSGRRVARDAVALDAHDAARPVRLTVRPMPRVDGLGPLFAVVLRERGPEEGDGADGAGAQEEAPAVEHLEDELRSTRAELKTTVEELEAANEELKSSNEELISTNEELQSANEELQTSKEELQSLNEELETVNDELRQKVDELGTANADLQNLFSSTSVATLFLDREMRIARFTPAATRLFHLMEVDVGRPVGDLATKLAGEDLVGAAREVLRTLAPVEREARTIDGASLVLRIQPYRTVENAVAGVVVTGVDVTALKRAEGAVLQNARLLHLAHDAIFVWSLDGGIEYWNDGARALYGFAPEEALGRRSHDLLRTAHAGGMGAVEAALRETGSWTGELVHRTRAGRTVTVLANLQLVPGPDGRARVFQANRDITERKAAEEELRRERDFASAVLETSGALVVVLDREDRIVRWNRACEALTGLSADAVRGRSLWTLGVIPGDAEDGVRETVEELQSGEYPNARENDWVARDGTRRAIAWSNTVMHGADGAVEYVIATGIDVTERRRAEREREHLVAELNATVSSIPDGLVVYRPDGSLAFMNPAAARLLGRPASDWDAPLEERARRMAVENEDGEPFPPHETPTARALRGEVVAPTPMAFRRGDGTRVWISAGAAPIETASGEHLGAVAVFSDVTDLKAKEARLRALTGELSAANAQLREADGRKNEFLGVLSHELRNPLTPVRNSVYLLERAAPGSEQARRALEVIGRQTSQLARLVDDLLDVTRVARNKIVLQRQPLDLNELVRQTVEDHASLFDGKGVALEPQLAAGPLPVLGDAARLAQVVGNLLQNAAKFTPAGGHVVVRTWRDPARRRAVLAVRDDGAGIAPEVVRRLFQPFMQADESLDRTKGGLGLGLALVKGLVEQHGGEVCAHSAGVGRGAEFAVDLPLDDAAPVAQGGRPGAATLPRKVLVIEDNADAAETLRDVLELSGHQVEIALDGPEGLAKARRALPDVVLCDIGLPGMDGYAVARAFRSDAVLRACVIVAVSGYALPEDLQRAADAGFHRHIAKPPSPEQLEDLLATLPRG